MELARISIQTVSQLDTNQSQNLRTVKNCSLSVMIFTTGGSGQECVIPRELQSYEEKLPYPYLAHLG